MFICIILLKEKILYDLDSIKVPDYKLDLLKENNLKFFDIDEVKKTAFFPLSSYLMVANGLDLFTKKININYYENITPNINQYLNLINDKSKEAIDHSEFLNKL